MGGEPKGAGYGWPWKRTVQVVVGLLGGCFSEMLTRGLPPLQASRDWAWARGRIPGAGPAPLHAAPDLEGSSQGDEGEQAVPNPDSASHQLCNLGSMP